MKRIESNSFADFSFIHSLRLTEDKKNIVYSLTKACVEDNNYKTNLWAYDLENNRNFQLTGSDKDSSFIILENGNILFSSGKDKPEKKTSYYEISLNGGESTRAFDIELAVSKIVQVSENKFLVSGSKFVDRNEGYHEVENLPFWFNGIGYSYDRKSSLYIFDSKENKLDSLISEEIDFQDFKYNKETGLIAYSYGSNDVNNFYNNISILNLETKENIKITNKDFMFNFFDFFDGKIIYTGHDMSKHGINEDSQIYTMNLDGSDDKRLSKDDFDMAFYNSTGTDLRFGGGIQMKVVDKKLYFIATERDHAYLYSIDIKGKATKVIDDKKSVEAFDLIGDTLVYSAFEDMNLVEIFARKGKKEEKLTDVSKDLENYLVSEPEHFTFKNDSNEFDGYVIKPLGYKEGKKYPGLLEIHGGPKTAYSDMIHHEMQLLANEGYFVFYTNPRGSSGRGVEFSDIRGKYGTIDFDDLMKFTDEVLDRYEDIDADRLGVLGGSYGGFMTNWIIGHTDRFKAANTQRSISNWTSFYGVSDIGYYFTTDQNQSSPWDNLDKLWEHSPLKHFENVKTPTLVIHSDEDYRCPLEQGLQVFTALKTKGVDTRLMIFNGENHELSRSGKPKNRVKRLDEIVSWFNKYLDNNHAK